MRQRARRTTGTRPDFGALQMRKVLIPALDDNEREILAGVEHMLDKLEREHGF